MIKGAVTEFCIFSIKDIYRTEFRHASRTQTIIRFLFSAGRHFYRYSIVLGFHKILVESTSSYAIIIATIIARTTAVSMRYMSFSVA